MAARYDGRDHSSREAFFHARAQGEPDRSAENPTVYLYSPYPCGERSGSAGLRGRGRVPAGGGGRPGAGRDGEGAGGSWIQTCQLGNKSNTSVYGVVKGARSTPNPKFAPIKQTRGKKGGRRVNATVCAFAQTSNKVFREHLSPSDWHCLNKLLPMTRLAAPRRFANEHKG